MILAEDLWQGVQLPPFPALSHLAWLMIPIYRSMLKSSLVAPMLELCCEALHEKPPQNGDDSVRSAMMAVHEALKSPSFQGTSPCCGQTSTTSRQDCSAVAACSW